MTDADRNDTNLNEDDLNDNGTMPLVSHLIELRNRLGVCIGIFLVLFIGSLVRPFGQDSRNFADVIFEFLQRPLANELAEQGGRMIFTALHEAFFTQIKVAFFAALFISFPVILLQVWRFVAPGLYRNERSLFAVFAGYPHPVLFGRGDGVLSGDSIGVGFLPVVSNCRWGYIPFG